MDEAQIVKDDKKGDYYVAQDREAGPAPRPRSSPKCCARRSSAISRGPRPCASIVGSRTARSCAGSGRCMRSCSRSTARSCRSRSPASKPAMTTRGHRFHGNEPFKVSGFADYAKALKSHKVILDGDARAALIAEHAHALAKDAKLTLVEDEALLAENAGLTEWPIVLMGEFDKAFLDGAGGMPDVVHEDAPEVLLAPAPARSSQTSFLLVANLKAKDGGKADRRRQREGDRARGCRTPSSSGSRTSRRSSRVMRDELKGITFHEKLGSQFERVERVEELARQIARSQELCRGGAGATRGRAGQGRPRVGHGRRVPRAAGAHGPLLRAKPSTSIRRSRARSSCTTSPRGRRDTVPLASEGDGAAVAAGARRQARHAGRLLGHRREADGLGRSLSAAARGAGRDPHRARERPAACLRAFVVTRVLKHASLSARSSFGGTGLRASAAVQLRNREHVQDTNCRIGQIAGRASDGPPRLLRRPAEGASARQGRAPRPHRRVFSLGRPGRPRADRQARRGAGRVPEDRRRRQSPGRRQARAEHPHDRGEEGQDAATPATAIAELLQASRRRRRWPPRSRR